MNNIDFWRKRIVILVWYGSSSVLNDLSFPIMLSPAAQAWPLPYVWRESGLVFKHTLAKCYADLESSLDNIWVVLGLMSQNFILINPNIGTVYP